MLKMFQNYKKNSLQLVFVAKNAATIGYRKCTNGTRASRSLWSNFNVSFLFMRQHPFDCPGAGVQIVFVDENFYSLAVHRSHRIFFDQGIQNHRQAHLVAKMFRLADFSRLVGCCAADWFLDVERTAIALICFRNEKQLFAIYDDAFPAAPIKQLGAREQELLHRQLNIKAIVHKNILNQLKFRKVELLDWVRESRRVFNSLFDLVSCDIVNVCINFTIKSIVISNFK